MYLVCSNLRGICLHACSFFLSFFLNLNLFLYLSCSGFFWCFEPVRQCLSSILGSSQAVTIENASSTFPLIFFWESNSTHVKDITLPLKFCQIFLVYRNEYSNSPGSQLQILINTLLQPGLLGKCVSSLVFSAMIYKTMLVCLYYLCYYLSDTQLLDMLYYLGPQDEVSLVGCVPKHVTIGFLFLCIFWLFFSF